MNTPEPIETETRGGSCAPVILLACPFCGHKPEVLRHGVFRKWWQIKCEYGLCLVQPRTDPILALIKAENRTLNAVVEQWNMRHEQANGRDQRPGDQNV